MASNGRLFSHEIYVNIEKNTAIGYYIIMFNYVLKKGNPFPMGPSATAIGMNLVVAVIHDRPLFLCLYNKKTGKREAKIEISKEYRTGNIYAFVISDINFSKLSYDFFDGEDYFCDPYAKKICGCEKWGKYAPKALFPENDNYDWEKDKNPRLKLEDVYLYTCNVRGFTKHASSNVEHRGCFEGIIEKIPYLKDLGINQIELMPAYNFNEVITANAETLPLNNMAKLKNTINYWGFADDALYFVPKSAYSGIGDGNRSMKDMVKACHSAGIEIIMQFYFPQHISVQLLIDCLRFWVMEYHIDGLCIMGSKIPRDYILSDPLLADTKFYMWDLTQDCDNGYRRAAMLRDSFMYDMRKFLKSDEDMLRSFTNHQLENPSEYGVVNFVTNYYGFSLMDLVSYDRKHNEANGEDNRDGTDYNFSWNCGYEGKCRKKNINNLRKKQIFNILTFLYLSAGIPMIMAGDEFGNSQNGNNNAYCQDNNVTWLDWKDVEKNKDIYEFIKELIKFRKESLFLHSDRPKTLMDKYNTGYPDVSYHGNQAWYPHFESYSRSLGCMYNQQDEFVYIAYNMYWIEEKLAIPKLPKGKKWTLIMDSRKGFLKECEDITNQEFILVPDRTVYILKAVDEA